MVRSIHSGSFRTLSPMPDSPVASSFQTLPALKHMEAMCAAVKVIFHDFSFLSRCQLELELEDVGRYWEMKCYETLCNTLWYSIYIVLCIINRYTLIHTDMVIWYHFLYHGEGCETEVEFNSFCYTVTVVEMIPDGDPAPAEVQFQQVSGLGCGLSEPAAVCVCVLYPHVISWVCWWFLDIFGVFWCNMLLRQQMMKMEYVASCCIIKCCLFVLLFYSLSWQIPSCCTGPAPEDLELQWALGSNAGQKGADGQKDTSCCIRWALSFRNQGCRERVAPSYALHVVPRGKKRQEGWMGQGSFSKGHMELRPSDHLGFWSYGGRSLLQTRSRGWVSSAFDQDRFEQSSVRNTRKHCRRRGPGDAEKKETTNQQLISKDWKDDSTCRVWRQQADQRRTETSGRWRWWQRCCARSRGAEEDTEAEIRPRGLDIVEA